MLEKEILEIPLYSALKAHDPAMYGKIRDILFIELENGTPLPQIRAKARSVFTDELIPKYLVAAPNEPLARYWRSQIAEMRALQNRDPKLCAAVLFPQFSKKSLALKSLLPKGLIDEDIAALSDVIKQTAVAPQNAEPTPETEQDLSDVMTSLSEKHPNLIDIIGEPEKHQGDPDALCQSFVRFYEGIFALGDPKRTGPLLRYLMAP